MNKQEIVAIKHYLESYLAETALYKEADKRLLGLWQSTTEREYRAVMRKWVNAERLRDLASRAIGQRLGPSVRYVIDLDGWAYLIRTGDDGLCVKIEDLG